MKKILCILLVCAQSTIILAKALNTLESAENVRQNLESTVMSIEGVNGIGITTCNPKTGEKTVSTKKYVYCVEISTETLEAYDTLKKLYPSPTQINSIFVTVVYRGTIKPEPRMTLGN